MDSSFEITDYPRSWVKEKYQEVQVLMKENEGKRDPNQLYEKKCKAVEILTEILDVLTKETFCTVMIAITHLNIGILQADMQDTEIAKEYFTRCITLLKDCKLTPEGILPAISANNQMGIVYAQQGLYQEAKEFLEEAESIYIKFTEEVRLDPVHMVAIMGIEEIEGDLSAKNVLEKLHTLTLYYLAQVCREVDDKCKFALYCHKTLSKQLSQNKITQDLDYIEWALNAATISQYFIENDKFPQARHHLAAAFCVLEQYSEILKAKGTEETNEIIAAEYERYFHKSADIARCWAKYGIALLSTSKERLMKRAEQEDEPDDSKKHVEVSNEVCKYSHEDETAEFPKFLDLEPELEVICSEITDKYLLDFDDARSVFLNVQKWLNKAKLYYSFENHASDYAYIMQDMSQAYKYLAFYETNEDRQAKMHKRRIDALEKVHEGLSPRFYRNICREIWLELAETYSEILNIKIDRLEALKEKPTNQMISKIERLARNSIKYYRLYVNSLEMKESNNGIASFLEGELYQALYSYFNIGRLFNKIITSVLEQKIENVEKSLEAYSFVADYYDKHPDIQDEFKKYEFIKLSRDFVALLPLSLEKLRQQFNQ